MMTVQRSFLVVKIPVTTANHRWPAVILSTDKVPTVQHSLISYEKYAQVRYVRSMYVVISEVEGKYLTPLVMIRFCKQFLCKLKIVISGFRDTKRVESNSIKS